MFNPKVTLTCCDNLLELDKNGPVEIQRGSVSPTETLVCFETTYYGSCPTCKTYHHVKHASARSASVLAHAIQGGN